LAKAEARLKTVQGGWRPDPQYVKVLSETKKHLQKKLIEALQIENQKQ